MFFEPAHLCNGQDPDPHFRGLPEGWGEGFARGSPPASAGQPAPTARPVTGCRRTGNAGGLKSSNNPQVSKIGHRLPPAPPPLPGPSGCCKGTARESARRRGTISLPAAAAPLAACRRGRQAPPAAGPTPPGGTAGSPAPPSPAALPPGRGITFPLPTRSAQGGAPPPAASLRQHRRRCPGRPAATHLRRRPHRCA